MGRLLAFLGCGVAVGFLAGGFQIPNMIPIMLVILWVGMGAGLRLGYALVGVVLMPLAIAAPMWFLPGPTDIGRIYPPDDSQTYEFYSVSGAEEGYEALREQYQKKADAQEAAVESGLVPLPAAKPGEIEPPTHYEAGASALAKEQGHVKRPQFDIWPRRAAWAVGLIITLAAFAVNTLSSGPFRDPKPLGQD